MKKILIIAIVAVTIFGGLIWLGRSNGTSSSGSSLTFAAIQQDATGGAKLYDVRTPDEYRAGHFSGAVNWSLQDLEAGSMPSVAKDTKIFVYCHSGNRSGQATALLKAAGYTNVTDLHGLASVEAIGGKLVTNE